MTDTEKPKKEKPRKRVRMTDKYTLTEQRDLARKRLAEARSAMIRRLEHCCSTAIFFNLHEEEEILADAIARIMAITKRALPSQTPTMKPTREP
jgi:hypothetical protein